MKSIFDKGVSLTIYPYSENLNLSNAFRYISAVFRMNEVSRPSQVIGTVLYWPSEVVTGDLIQNLGKASIQINNNLPLEFCVVMSFSESLDSSDKYISDSINYLMSIKPDFYVAPKPQPMPGYGYGYDYGYYGGGEIVVETKPRICPKDMLRCPDGSLVGRDEFCNFRPCPQPQQSYGDGGEEVIISML